MKNSKECLVYFNKEKNSGLTTETALRLTFNALRLSVPTLILDFGAPDKIIFPSLEKMRSEWNAFIKKVDQSKHGFIRQGLFEELSKETQSMQHNKWLKYRKKKKK